MKPQNHWEHDEVKGYGLEKSAWGWAVVKGHEELALFKDISLAKVFLLTLNKTDEMVGR